MAIDEETARVEYGRWYWSLQPAQRWIPPIPEVEIMKDDPGRGQRCYRRRMDFASADSGDQHLFKTHYHSVPQFDLATEGCYVSTLDAG